MYYKSYLSIILFIYLNFCILANESKQNIKNVAPDLIIDQKLNTTNQPQSEQTNILPESVLAFPENNLEYQNKIINKINNYEIWTEAKIQEWARTINLAITSDSNEKQSTNYKQGILFKSPGLAFKLKIPNIEQEMSPSNLIPNYILVLDLALLKNDPRKKVFNMQSNIYSNILKYDIYINNINVRKIEIGYGKTEESPIYINIPNFRNKNKEIKIEIKLHNNASQFGFLYDAYIYKEEE